VIAFANADAELCTHTYRLNSGVALMKTIALRRPGGLDRSESANAADPGAPAHGQIRARIHASSLSFHDLLVVMGRQPVADSRVPMTDGAGVVEAVGDRVTEFVVGDSVVSTFFPH